MHATYISDLTREYVRFTYTFWRRSSAITMAETIERHFFTIYPTFTLEDRWTGKRVTL